MLPTNLPFFPGGLQLPVPFRVEQADIEWSQNTTRRAPAVDQRGYEQDGSPFYGTSQYTKARTVRENYQAKLAKVEYEERVGNLLQKDAVEQARFTEFRQFRDRMLNIPDRVSALLAAESDPAKCHEILAAEIHQALTDYAEGNATDP